MKVIYGTLIACPCASAYAYAHAYAYTDVHADARAHPCSCLYAYACAYAYASAYRDARLRLRLRLPLPPHITHIRSTPWLIKTQKVAERRSVDFTKELRSYHGQQCDERVLVWSDVLCMSTQGQVAGLNLLASSSSPCRHQALIVPCFVLRYDSGQSGSVATKI